MDALQLLYQQFDPARPLDAAEIELYVDWQRIFGSTDVKRLLANSITRSGAIPVTRLFTGHRGVGKTTELKRVQQTLLTGRERKMFASFFEAERWMDLQDVQPQDIIFGIVRQLVADLNSAGFQMGSEKFKQFVQELGELLRREVEFKDIKFKTGAVDIGLALKEVPAVRSKIRALLQARLPTILDLVNTVILRSAREWLRKAENGGYDDVVLVVDELDRIPQRVLNAQGLTNHENVFLDSAGTLRALECDVLYTIPIELAYSRSRQRLRAIYGSDILTLPVIPIADRSGIPDPRGTSALRQIIQTRSAKAGVGPGELFDSEQALDRICAASGGHVRNLLILIRSAIDYADTLPLGPEIINLTLKREAESISLALGGEEWAILQAVHATKKAPVTVGEAWYALLRDLYVFSYSDLRGTWYDWNPLLTEVEPA